MPAINGTGELCCCCIPVDAACLSARVVVAWSRCSLSLIGAGSREEPWQSRGALAPSRSDASVPAPLTGAGTMRQFPAGREREPPARDSPVACCPPHQGSPARRRARSPRTVSSSQVPMPVSSPAIGGVPALECSTRNARAAAATIRSVRRAGRPCRMRPGIQRGVGGRRGGVAGGVSAVGPVGVGGGGDGPPRGADLLVVQVGGGGQAERGERVGGHGRVSCLNTSSR